MNKTVINGIDVSECPLFDKKTGCYHTFNGECAKNSCAVYKWLLEHKRLQKENDELKKRQVTKNGFICDCEQNVKYKQALEEIRKKITPVCADCNNIDGFTTWDDCENVCEKGVIKYLKIIDEVLNEQK